MPPLHPQSGRYHPRNVLRTASPAVEIIARRLLKSKGKSIVPPELLSRPKKKRDPSVRASISYEIPKKNIDDSVKKLNKIAGRIGFYAIKQNSGENFDILQARWSDYRKTVKSCFSVDDLRDRLLGIAMLLDDRFLHTGWITSSKDRWLEACQNAGTSAEVQTCLREFEQDAICWEKVEYVHELMDISNQIPTSQVKTSDPKFWFEDYPDKLRDSAGPKEMAKHLKELCMQLRPSAEIVDKEWVQQKKSDWLRLCTACDSWPEFKSLMTTFDEGAIDWRDASRIMRRENENKEVKEERPSEEAKGAASSKVRESRGDPSPCESEAECEKENSRAKRKRQSANMPSTGENGEGERDEVDCESTRAIQGERATEVSEDPGPDASKETKKALSKKRAREHLEASVQRKGCKKTKDPAAAKVVCQSRMKRKVAGKMGDSSTTLSASLPAVATAAENASSPPAPCLGTCTSHTSQSESAARHTSKSESAAGVAASSDSGPNKENNAAAEVESRCDGDSAGKSGRSELPNVCVASVDAQGASWASGEGEDSGVCSNNSNVDTGVKTKDDTKKKSKVPRQASKQAVTKPKPAVKSAGPVQPRTGLEEAISNAAVSGAAQAMEQLMGSGQFMSSGLAGVNPGGMGVWDGTGQMALRYSQEDLGTGHFGGRPMGSMAQAQAFAASQGSQGAGYIGAMGASGAGAHGGGFLGNDVGRTGLTGSVLGGGLGLGMQAGRGYQTAGLGFQAMLGYPQQQDSFNLQRLGLHGDQTWNYFAQAQAQAANIRMQQLHSVSMVSIEDHHIDMKCCSCLLCARIGLSIYRKMSIVCTFRALDTEEYEHSCVPIEPFECHHRYAAN
jgi:hypothetical protein